MKFSHELVINKNREEVWKIFDNIENMPKWQPTLKSFEPQSGTPGQVGAVSALTYEENGRKIVLTETITSRNYPEEFSGSYTSPQVNNYISNRFISVDDSTTKWVMECEFTGQTFLFKLLTPLMKGMFVKRTVKDMNQFKQLAESL